MPYKNTDISSYSTTELMRYAKGQMSRMEMYALEKAVMEDPFLAEALEGYMEAVAQQPAQLVAEQVDRINAAPTDQSKAPVIPLWRRKAVQIAVAACFIVGASWFVFSLLQKPQPQSNEVATAQKTGPMLSPSDSSSANSLAVDKTLAYQPLIHDSQFQSPMTVAQNQKPEKNLSSVPSNIVLQRTADATTASGEISPSPIKDSTAMYDMVGAIPAVPGRETAALSKKEDRATMRQTVFVPQHIFKGRITDASNNPLPYANIMVEGQNVGTYSDLSGTFNFVSEDSILPVRVRSVGYLNQAVALKEEKQEMKIVLQQDKQLNDNLPLTVQQKTNSISPTAKSIIERDSISGAEMTRMNAPYYDIYLLNNNRISPQLNLNRQVQLSFEISKEGEATNITVVKSSGKALDEEAIRLIKEGPKLSPANRAGTKKKVTVRF